MHRTTNSMRTTLLLRTASWYKSSHSNPHGDCVEFAEVTCRLIAVRNSRDPDGPTLILDRAEIDAFILDVQGGRFEKSDNAWIRQFDHIEVASSGPAHSNCTSRASALKTNAWSMVLTP